MKVEKSKIYNQENNLIGYSSVDTNIEDWTYWYESQPCIDEVTYQISPWWLILHVPQGRPSDILKQNVKM